MYVVGLYSFLFCLGASQGFVQSTDWVDSLTKNIIKDSELRTLTVITRLLDNEILENRIFDKLFQQLMRKVPTFRINIPGNSQLPVNFVPEEKSGTIDTSSTLFLIAIQSHDSLPFLVTKELINVVAEMAKFHYRAKYLVVSCARKPSDRVPQSLRYAWTKKLLDFTIVELIEPEIPSYSILGERPVALPMIQQFNPFEGVYTREKWNSHKNLFPKKLDNVQGYPLRIRGPDRQKDGIEDRCEIRVLRAFVEELNFSPIFIESGDPLNKQMDPRRIRDEIESDDVDITADLHPHSFLLWNNSQRLSMILNDQFCAAVPILPVSQYPYYTNPLKGYILSFGIVLIFWIFLKLLGYGTYSSKIFNICRVFFGIPVAQQPRDHVQRIIFACLLALFATYSSTIYSSITDIALPTENEKKFESLDDLNDSGTLAYVLASDWLRTTELFLGSLKKLKTGIRRSSDKLWCVRLLNRHRKFICLTSKYMLDTFVSARPPGRRLPMKFAKPCFWNDHLSFLVGKRSPYRQRFDRVISRLHSSGLIAKTNLWEYELKLRTQSSTKQRNTKNLVRQLIVVGVIGYGLSIAVLWAEIIFHCISMYKRSKDQITA